MTVVAPRRGLTLLAALFVAALALRPQLVGVGPLLPDIQDDLGVSHAVAGLLGTIPVLCMGVFAPAAARIAGRAQLRAVVTWCIAAVALFGLARAAVPGAPLLLDAHAPDRHRHGGRRRAAADRGEGALPGPAGVRQRRLHDRAQLGAAAVGGGRGAGGRRVRRLARCAGRVLGGRAAPVRRLGAAQPRRVDGALGGVGADAGPAPGRVDDRDRVRAPVARLLRHHDVDARRVPGARLERRAAGALLAVLGFSTVPGGLLVPWLADRSARAAAGCVG